MRVPKRTFTGVQAVLFLLAMAPASQAHPPGDSQFYSLDARLTSRSISFENPTGGKGQGGTAANHLGIGRKGSPARSIARGESVTLCSIEGPGTIRHIWMTGSFNEAPASLRSMVVRGYWEGQEHPSIECPLGDFMGLAHGVVRSYQSAVHSVGESAALNLWAPMPFRNHARLTLTNEGEEPVVIFYQIDYTVNDTHPDEFGRLHVCFRRENLTTLKRDFEVLPKREGPGRYLGAVLGIRSLDDKWWGEGEIKIFLDGDTEFPTICGTGSEDYVCLSYGMQQTPFLYHGCSLNEDGYISIYRWHIPDPVYWNEDCRITIQQIGYDHEIPDKLYERQDDWSCATFWYEPAPSAPLPAFPGVKERIADVPDQ